MSRRKQSNPKPIKHEGEEEGINRSEEHVPDRIGVISSKTDIHTSSFLGRTKAFTNDTSCNITIQSHEEKQCSQTAKPFSDDAVGLQHADDEDSKSNKLSKEKDSFITQESEDSFHDTSMSATSETLKDTKISTTDCSSEDAKDNNVATSNHNPSNNFEAHVKRELSVSPTQDGAGDSDGSTVSRPKSAASSYKLASTSRRRNRSRSRSSSKPIGHPSSPDAPSNSCQSREEAERALVNQLQLPSDVLYLKQLDMTIQGTLSVGWVVCCAIPLPQGSSLGPFQGQLVPPEAVKVGDLIVQFTNKKGQQALMNVAGQSGGWLALLRSSAVTTERNTHVYWEGGRIWCEIIADIDIGTELKATFSFQNDDDIDEEDDDEVTSTADVKDIEVSSNEDNNAGVQHHQHPYQQQVAPGHAALIYGCPFCGVRFSSPRTLQGHLSFYCSKKTSEQIVSPVSKERDKGSNQNKLPAESITVKQEPDVPFEKEPHDVKQQLDANTHSDSADLPSSSTQGRPGQAFKCKHCSYKADKLSSLNRHMRMHNNDKVKVTISQSDERAGINSREKVITAVRSPNSETFCKECRIQFSNFHTYKCHKEHYCAQRRKKALADPSAFAAMFHSPFSFHDPAKVGIPSALQMAALNQGGLILPGADDAAGTGSATVLLSTPVLTATGMANIAISLPTMLMPGMVKGKDVVSTLKSSRNKRSPEKQQAHSSSSQPSQLPVPLAHFLNMSATASVDYTRALEELHKSNELISIKSDPVEDDHPLDLTVAKKRIKLKHDSSQDVTQSKSTFLQSERDGLSETRRMRGSSSGTLDIHQHLQHNKEEHNSPSSSPVSQGTSKAESADLKNDVASAESHIPHILRSERITPNHMMVQVLPHPSLLVPSSNFLTMPLTLSPPAKRAPLSPSGTPNGISKCGDCNIVFYKHDNYLIHKKHYCSGKRRSSLPPSSTAESSYPPVEPDTKTNQETQKQSSTPQAASPPVKIKKDPEGKCMSSEESPRTSNPSPPKHSNEVKYKFFCVPCRIKFSNSSILEAHKEYYCPAGKDSEQSVIVQTATSETVSSPKDDRDHTSPDSHQDEFTCTRCNSIFVSARLLRLHVCDDGFPCPHCDHVSVTENRLAEHLKVHAPTKAYRCTICGYRGNTARGMRMHGKTHIDEGLNFTDENMLAYHEPALIPVVHSPYPGMATDSELLRLKNEPYKRRRSRKAYEKFDYPLPKVDIPQTCSLCGQNFANADFLASHLKVHEIAASQFLPGLLKCSHCSYIAQTAESLLSHLESSHAGSNRNKRPRLTSPDREEQSLNTRSSSPSMFSQSKRPESEENGENVSLNRESNLSPEEPSAQLKHIESDLSSSSHLHVSSDQQMTVKTEPVDEDSKSSSKFSHFLQTPIQSPDSYSTDNSDAGREHGSRPSSRTGAKVYSPCRNLLYEQQPEYLAGTENRLQSSGSFKVEAEPGEIIATRVKKEPVYESSEETEMRPKFKSRIGRDSKSDSSDPENDNRAEKFGIHVGDDEVTSDMSRPKYNKNSTRLPNHAKDEVDFKRSPPPTSTVARLGRTSPNSAITTPNFLVNSPPPSQENLNHSSGELSARLTSSTPSFHTIQSHLSAASLTAALPATQSHAMSFPCITPQIALPYLFLSPIQPGPSLPVPRSPSLRDDRTTGSRYCQNCDISFSKHATYLAHKKYYCTARPRGEVQSSAKA